MTSYVTPKKGFPFIFYVGLVSQSTGQFQSNPTLAAGDFKVSKDGGALANLATLPAVTPASSKSVKISLDSGETDADNIIIIGSDAAGAEWDDVFINIQTTVSQIDDLALASSIPSAATIADSVWDEDATAHQTQGTFGQAIGDPVSDSDTIWNLVNTNLDTTISSRASQTSLDVLDDYVDTEVAAIKAKTDQLLFSAAGNVKADMKEIDEQATNGNNATLNLKQLNIVNSAGDALVAKSSGGNGYGLWAEGNGTGAGILGFNSGGGGVGIAATTFSENYAVAITGGGGLSVQGNIFEGLHVQGATDSIILDATSGKSISALDDIAVSDGDLTLAAIASAVWANATRALTSYGTLITDIWSAVVDSAGVTTLLSRIASALNISGGKVEANVKQINDTTLTGDGSSGNPWGPV